jgi:hypothetical protein
MRPVDSVSRPGSLALANPLTLLLTNKGEKKVKRRTSKVVRITTTTAEAISLLAILDNRTMRNELDSIVISEMQFRNYKTVADLRAAAASHLATLESEATDG